MRKAKVEGKQISKTLFHRKQQEETFMTKTYTIATLKGDGIGPEVPEATVEKIQ